MLCFKKNKGGGGGLGEAKCAEITDLMKQSAVMNFEAGTEALMRSARANLQATDRC